MLRRLRAHVDELAEAAEQAIDEYWSTRGDASTCVAKIESCMVRLKLSVEKVQQSRDLRLLEREIAWASLEWFEEPTNSRRDAWLASVCELSDALKEIDKGDQ